MGDVKHFTHIEQDANLYNKDSNIFASFAHTCAGKDATINPLFQGKDALNWFLQ
jgi:hypothetical protein